MGNEIALESFATFRGRWAPVIVGRPPDERAKIIRQAATESPLSREDYDRAVEWATEEFWKD